MADPTVFTDLKLDGEFVGATDGTQAAHIADAAVTATLSGVADGTDMTASQAATIVTDLTTLKTKLNAVLAALEDVGILASS